MTSAGADLSDFLSSPGTEGVAGAVATFGDREAEYRALRESAGVLWRADERAYCVRGEERADFLHRLLTADIKGIAAGACSTSLLLDNKGRVQLVLEVGATPDELVAVGPTAELEAGMETLARYILRSDVEIAPLESAVIALIGPAADVLMNAAELSTLECPPQAFRASWGWLLVAPAPVDTWQRLVAEGAVPAGLDAAESLRIAQRRARSGSEMTGAEFPQELRLEAAVDFEKGCYLGQETVARIHYRGQVNRLLCVLESAAMLRVGEALLAEEKNVGRVTSVAPGEGANGVGLALVARDFSDAGTKLTTESGASVAVIEASDGH